MKVLKGKNVIVRDGDLKRREQTNRNYLMSLTNDNLLFNYRYNRININLNILK